MKILHIVGDSKFGGGSVVILRLAQKAKELGWKVDVLTTDSIFQGVLKENKIGIVNLDVIWRDIRIFRDIKGLYRLYKFLKNNKYDIVHTHTSKAGFIGRLAAKLAGVPIIIHTVHGFAFHEESNPLFLYVFSSLERLASYWCDRIVTVSNFHKEWALELRIGNIHKIVAIPNGIPFERVIPTKSYFDMRKDLGISNDEFVILATGRLAPQKGLEFLIRAIPYLDKMIVKPYKILIVGDGPLRNYLRDLSKELHVEDKVMFLGFRTDIGNLLNMCDVVVLPSLWEGLSIALLEAMAAGKPIITTTIGSNKEVIQDGYSGILVPKKDPIALANAIYKIFINKELSSRLGENAKKVYFEKYQEDLMLEKYINLYKELMEEKQIW